MDLLRVYVENWTACHGVVRHCHFLITYNISTQASSHFCLVLEIYNNEKKPILFHIYLHTCTYILYKHTHTHTHTHTHKYTYCAVIKYTYAYPNSACILHTWHSYMYLQQLKNLLQVRITHHPTFNIKSLNEGRKIGSQSQTLAPPPKLLFRSQLHNIWSLYGMYYHPYMGCILPSLYGMYYHPYMVCTTIPIWCVLPPLYMLEFRVCCLGWGQCRNIL